MEKLKKYLVLVYIMFYFYTFDDDEHLSFFYRHCSLLLLLKIVFLVLAQKDTMILATIFITERIR